MILRWAGSKAKQVNAICQQLNTRKKRLIEPFCGTGIISLSSFFFDEYWINDANPDLINFFKNFSKLKLPANLDKERFIAKREKFNESSRKGIKAAQMFWDLNRNCHRGLMNYGACGQLITSYGAKADVTPAYVSHYKKLLSHDKLMITSKDYKQVIRKSTEDDCIYIDPPYYDSTSRYNSEYFGPDQQTELALEIEAAAERGATVLVSNYDLPFTRFLYRSADSIITPAGSSQNLKKGKKELLARWN